MCFVYIFSVENGLPVLAVPPVLHRETFYFEITEDLKTSLSVIPSRMGIYECNITDANNTGLLLHRE